MTTKTPSRACQDPSFIPTPAEIRRAAREIQSTWTEGDERSRRTGSARKVPYELPEVGDRGDRAEAFFDNLAAVRRWRPRRRRG